MSNSRTYVITGVASGIGAACADMVIAGGGRVLGVDLHGSDVVADLSSPDGRDRMVSEIERRSDGRVDAVIACAGTVGRGPIDVAVNYFGAVATLDRLRPLLASGSAPRAVAVSSFAVLETVDDVLVRHCLDGDESAALARVRDSPSRNPMGPYAASKRALARWVRRQSPTPAWAGAGIALNAVAPGIVRTPMTAPLLDDPTSAERLRATVPMPFGGETDADSVARVVTFLASAELTAVTGQLLFVDGGADCVRRGDDIWR